MDFFARQEKTQTRSRIFLFAFGLTALGALFVLYLVVTGCLAVTTVSVKILLDAIMAEAGYHLNANYEQYLPAVIYGSPPDIFSFRPVFVITSFIALFLALISTLKILRLRIGGGAYVAKSLGGRPLTEPINIQERRLVNVVEEMAVASGLPRPRLYILPKEKNINAVTAGRNHEDAVIIVTQGALDQLDRDELQGVMAHEFAHILNDDSVLNLSMSGWLAGLLFFYWLGYNFVETAINLMKDKSGTMSALSRSWVSDRLVAIPLIVAIPVFLAGFLLLAGGWLGKVAAEIFQAAFSRQREYLADAFAVGFTRNPLGLAGALKKIALTPQQGFLSNGRSLAMKSFFIVSPARILGLFKSHPPLKKRILALDPAWDGRSTGPGADGIASLPSPDRAEAPHLSPDRGANQDGSLASARQWLSTLPEEIRQAVDRPDRAPLLIAALFLHDAPDLAARQGDIIERIMGPEAGRPAENLKARISDETRLPLLALAAPTLKELSGAERLRLLRTAQRLAEVDGRTDFFEVAALHILRRYLDLPSAPPGDSPGPEALEEAAAALVSIMAHVGSADPQAVERVFRFALGLFTNKPFPLAPRAAANSEELARALDRLAAAPEADRRRLVSALSAAALSDQTVTRAEDELLKAVAAALDVPRPLIDQ